MEKKEGEKAVGNSICPRNSERLIHHLWPNKGRISERPAHQKSPIKLIYLFQSLVTVVCIQGLVREGWEF